MQIISALHILGWRHTILMELKVRRLAQDPWLLFSRIRGLHPGRGISSVICGCFFHCGNSDEKEINEKWIHEANFINHQVFLELLRCSFFLTHKIERSSQGLSNVMVIVQQSKMSAQCMVNDLRRSFVQKKRTRIMIFYCALSFPQTFMRIIIFGPFRIL